MSRGPRPSSRGTAQRIRRGAGRQGRRAHGPSGARETDPDPESPGELPLLAWGEARRAAAALRRRRQPIGLLAAVGIVALAFAAFASPAPRWVWNASASAPVGLYRVMPGADVAAGDMAVVRLPVRARALAARRRYLPADVPAVKRVVATAGARVCARGAAISIDGFRVATRLAADRRGRPLPWWRGCRTLERNEIFLLMRESRESFDGRYFGPSERRDVIGRATLQWSPDAAGARR